jgi:hypothetical protein
LSTRFFTLEEANALLPRLEDIIGEMLAARQRILDKQEELWPVLEKASRNGGSQSAGAVVSEFETVRRSVRAIEDMGVTLKDVNTGLLDFLTIRDGREVYLCWRYGEAHIGYWHELHTGFAGRQPI